MPGGYIRLVQAQSVYLNVSRLWFDQTYHEIKKCRLADARGSNDRPKVSPADAQRRICQNASVVISKINGAEIDSLPVGGDLCPPTASGRFAGGCRLSSDDVE